MASQGMQLQGLLLFSICPPFLLLAIRVCSCWSFALPHKEPFSQEMLPGTHTQGAVSSGGNLPTQEREGLLPPRGTLLCLDPTPQPEGCCGHPLPALASITPMGNGNQAHASPLLLLASSTWSWVAQLHSGHSHFSISGTALPIHPQHPNMDKDGSSARSQFPAPTHKRQQQTCFKTTPLLGTG